jgi:hypothetical protein
MGFAEACDPEDREQAVEGAVMPKDYEIAVTVTLEGVFTVEGAESQEAAIEEACRQARAEANRKIGDNLEIALVDGQVA